MLRHPFKISLLFGIPMVLIGVLLLFINPIAENNLIEGFITPIVAFEFIQSLAEVEQYFNVSNPNIYRNDMLLGNVIDFGFMFCYSSFLGFTALGLLKESKDKFLWLPVSLTVIIFFADVLENFTIAAIIHSFFESGEVASSHFGNLKFFTWLKWGSIAAVFLMLSSHFWQRNMLGKFIAVIGIINFVIAAVAFFHRSVLNEVLAGLVLVLFISILIHNLLFKINKSVLLE